MEPGDSPKRGYGRKKVKGTLFDSGGAEKFCSGGGNIAFFFVRSKFRGGPRPLGPNGPGATEKRCGFSFWPCQLFMYIVSFVYLVYSSSGFFRKNIFGFFPPQAQKFSNLIFKKQQNLPKKSRFKNRIHWKSDWFGAQWSLFARSGRIAIDPCSFAALTATEPEMGQRFRNKKKNNWKMKVEENWVIKWVKFTGQFSIIAYFWRFTDGLQCDSANDLLITRDVEYYHGIFQCRSTCGNNQSSSLLINSRTVLSDIITSGCLIFRMWEKFSEKFLGFWSFFETNLERKDSWARGGGRSTSNFKFIDRENIPQ